MSRRKKVLVVATPIVTFLILTPLVTYALLARDISDPERLMNRSNTGIELLDIHDQPIFSTGTSKSLTRLKLSEISDYAEKALVSSEDKNFYQHDGFSVTGTLAALYANIANRDATAYGGSTITQQLVKNRLLSKEKSFFRKYQEVAMSIAIEQQYTKDEILDMYMNSIFYGEGAFGIDEAARTYFNKPAADLDLAESAMLIGILPAPSAYSPVSGDEAKAKKQQERVLRRMAEDGKITDVQHQQALGEQLVYAPPQPAPENFAPHFTEMILDELTNKYGEERAKRSGYRVKTTLDLSWQKQADKIVSDQTALNAPRGGRNAALVAIDPKTGAVRALVGSSNYDDPVFGKVNMAITPRQPGSTFKPIYYTEAINQKLITAATVIKDEATDFGGYKPENFDFRYRGDITIRNALSQSLNIPAIKVMQKLGVDKSVDKAREMGINSVSKDADYGLSLAIGSAEAKPLEMTNAFAAFANGGRQYESHLIDSIENKYSETIFRYESKSKRVQSSEASFIMSDILSDNTARAPTFGSVLNIPGRKVAVKTGSTDENRDAWTIGYTPSVSVGVWVGNNEHEVMTAGGSSMAGPIWKKSIIAFLGDTPAESFAQPSSVTRSATCSASGGSYEEYFMSGTVPSNTCVSKKQPAAEPKEEKKESEDSSPANNPSKVDTDNDGVTDDKDKCPATPQGVQVDKDGCPVVLPTDTDNDGVTDDKDKCPATPQGVQVDKDGCPVSTAPAQPGLIPLIRSRY